MVSVIVTTFNRPDSLENCIKHLISIEDYNYIIEIIVIDDCSTYNLANQNKLFCQDITKVKYFYNLENRGLAYSRNIGASNSVGEYIFFLDDDIMVQKNYFKNQLDLLKSNNCVTIGNISFSKSALNNNNLTWTASTGIPFIIKKTYCVVIMIQFYYQFYRLKI